MVYIAVFIISISVSSSQIVVNKCCTSDKTNRECLHQLYQNSKSSSILQNNSLNLPTRFIPTPDNNSGKHMNFS